jgi:hypothetical protein
MSRQDTQARGKNIVITTRAEQSPSSRSCFLGSDGHHKKYCRNQDFFAYQVLEK